MTRAYLARVLVFRRPFLAGKESPAAIMKICSQCGNGIRNEAKLCDKCGSATFLAPTGAPGAKVTGSAGCGLALVAFVFLAVFGLLSDRCGGKDSKLGVVSEPVPAASSAPSASVRPRTAAPKGKVGPRAAPSDDNPY